MALMVVGLSHRTASLEVLERAAFDARGAEEVLRALTASPHVEEAFVLSTCNRVELYCDVSRFHGGVADIGDVLCRRIGRGLDELGDQLYVHYEDAGVEHLFKVACGLDSMAVGESQILGQLRLALRGLHERGLAGGTLDRLLQTALRVGKRAHSETRLDAAGASLVDTAMTRAAGVVGELPGRRALVVGAGAMSALVATTLARAGLDVVVANRTPDRAQRLAAAVGGRATGLDDLRAEVAAADLVVSCTGAVGHVLDVATVASALLDRPERPLFLADLALPRDVHPDVATLRGAHLVDLEGLGADLASSAVAQDLRAVRAIVAEEVAAHAASLRAADVAPTVVALRAQARHVVEVEMRRLASRVDLDDTTRSEVDRAVHRIVEKLLHTPTVRVKELAEAPGGVGYAAALRALFDLEVTAQGGALPGDAPLSGTVADAVGHVS
ncbi:glutamyl-tRNA reductase [Kineococcus radiotolerans]|uniref:Glutamyl-tRNA reductase n=2 Tax=Kineococcus radiotolerans TaxID=131568 RepID=HEM1_KINRD|nr:RecName: Full=Glutamyl-tRNA reductase; Short=GluTR [Kineococcus radiotolerans SRS30216 = ATCC BAA-149]ABS02106.1 Glutamyl-tRNA reductase [Kineococcus radiotolerans SRS30216 = ATCC BAA-149]MBB2900731.1 glutamyl-tRNA reductase [Kineococcus radiotolerans]